VQKEAYFFGKRSIIVRDETEWSELVSSGANRLVGADAASICRALAAVTEPLQAGCQFYGSGDAGRQIVDVLVREFIRAPAGEVAA
jgi:UDP-GlcNAc3NAcA epimerase